MFQGLVQVVSVHTRVSPVPTYVCCVCDSVCDVCTCTWQAGGRAQAEKCTWLPWLLRAILLEQVQHLDTVWEKR